MSGDCHRRLFSKIPKREFRGAWENIEGKKKMRSHDNGRDQQWFINSLDRLQQLGCNAILSGRPQADAFYESDIEPGPFSDREQGSPDAAGTYGIFDQRLMRAEWSFTPGSIHIASLPTIQRYSIPTISISETGDFQRYGKQLYFDRASLNRFHTVKVIVDIVNNMTWMQFFLLSYFYPYPVPYEEFHDDDSFVKYGKTQGFEYWQKNDWRRNNVETLMREINSAIKAIKPWIRFGISPFGIHRNLKDTPDGSGSKTNGLSNYEQLFADVPAGLRKASSTILYHSFIGK